LFSFHAGSGIVHLDTFFEKKVDIKFYFLETEKILKLLSRSGFNIISALERFPYPNVEYPSKRAYILAEKIK
jgi:hypothetical protein